VRRGDHNPIRSLLVGVVDNVGLSSRRLAVAFVVAVVVTFPQVDGLAHALGPSFLLRAMVLVLTVCVGVVSFVVIMLRYARL